MSGGRALLLACFASATANAEEKSASAVGTWVAEGIADARRVQSPGERAANNYLDAYLKDGGGPLDSEDVYLRRKENRVGDIRTKGVLACLSKDRDGALRSLSQLQPRDRPVVLYVCSQNGIEFDLGEK